MITFCILGRTQTGRAYGHNKECFIFWKKRKLLSTFLEVVEYGRQLLIFIAVNN